MPRKHPNTGFAVGIYGSWDGVETCEQAQARRERERANGVEQFQRREATRMAEHPRRVAFVEALNRVLAKHGAYLDSNDGRDTVVFGVRRYEIDEWDSVSCEGS